MPVPPDGLGRRLDARYRGFLRPYHAARRAPSGWPRRRQLGGCYFRRQAPIGDYIVDFACFERNLVVEVDGGQHTVRVAQDTKRSEWLESQGYRVLRFWNNDVLQNVDGVVDTILAALREP